jgi:hypothetical protein
MIDHGSPGVEEPRQPLLLVDVEVVCGLHEIDERCADRVHCPLKKS